MNIEKDEFGYYTAAIKSLDPEAEFSATSETGDSVDTINWITTPVPESEIDDEVVRLKAEWTAQEYARNRASDYPNNGDQWDMIYKDNKNSTSTHAAAVEAVKTKWPKDNSGPV